MNQLFTSTETRKRGMLRGSSRCDAEYIEDAVEKEQAARVVMGEDDRPWKNRRARIVQKVLVAGCSCAILMATSTVPFAIAFVGANTNKPVVSSADSLFWPPSHELVGRFGLGHLGIRGGSTAAPPASARNVAARIGEKRNGSYADGYTGRNGKSSRNNSPRNGRRDLPDDDEATRILSSNKIVRPISSLTPDSIAPTKNGSKKATFTVGTMSAALSAALEVEDHASEIIPVEYVAETALPTDLGHFRLRAYRIEKDWTPSSENFRKLIQYMGTEPCVIYNSDIPPGKHSSHGVPVRIHDQCFTSEVFRSQRCDCKEQLQMALNFIQEHGGAVIYLQQEGRGIGLANKVAAYALQDSGMDTVDANTHLGFPEDGRQYGMVPGILSDLGIKSIQLMTNNPFKIDRLKKLGVQVEGTIPMVVKSPTAHNRKYLETKVERMNHTDLDALLRQSDASEDGQINGSSSSGRSRLSKSVNGANAVLDDVPEMPEIVQLNDIEIPSDISDGATTAARAVTQALLDDTTQSGVSAKEDGYCFGKESVVEAIAAVKRGEMVVVVDDEGRENEGDFIAAADLVTPRLMADMIRYTSGVICVGMEGERMDALALPAMVGKNQDPKGTAFSVTVDAAPQHGISTGISATDRAKTIQLLSDSKSTESDFVRPGHIFPLRARDGGTIARDGHTEASVDLARLAGLNPCGVLCEIVSEENPIEMARLPELKRFCKKHGYVMTSIVDIAQYRREMDL